MILGITGGLGCGKSTAARFFAQRGFRHLDSDALVREYVFAQPAVVAALRARFGPEAVAADGAVNRAQIAGVVFADDATRRWLEELTHPPLFARWRELFRAEPAASWVVEVPLLFEKQLENWFDFIACVTCALEQQMTRLEQRGLARALAAQRISKQLPLARKVELSDFVLLNDGSAEFLQRQVDLLIDALPVVRS
ncbi:MAG: dephospho-CoA kinase [Opitutaceae bacterium]|nr:dephospho-CoA kinase [Opitutaceae bacterium]